MRFPSAKLVGAAGQMVSCTAGFYADATPDRAHDLRHCSPAVRGAAGRPIGSSRGARRADCPPAALCRPDRGAVLVPDRSVGTSTSGLGPGGYRTLAPGARPQPARPHRGRPSRRRAGHLPVAASSPSRPTLRDGHDLPMHGAHGPDAAVGDSGAPILIDGRPAGIAAREFGGKLGFRMWVRIPPPRPLARPSHRCQLADRNGSLHMQGTEVRTMRLTTRRLAGILFAAVALVAVSIPRVGYAAAPNARIVTPAGIVINGSNSDWDNQSADFLSDMYTAGKPDKPVLAKFYARYDCGTKTFYAHVVTVSGWVIVPSNNDNYVKLGQTDKLVDGSDAAWRQPAELRLHRVEGLGSGVPPGTRAATWATAGSTCTPSGCSPRTAPRRPAVAGRRLDVVITCPNPTPTPTAKPTPTPTAAPTAAPSASPSASPTEAP